MERNSFPLHQGLQNQEEYTRNSDQEVILFSNSISSMYLFILFSLLLFSLSTLHFMGVGSGTQLFHSADTSLGSKMKIKSNFQFIPSDLKVGLVHLCLSTWRKIAGNCSTW